MIFSIFNSIYVLLLNILHHGAALDKGVIIVEIKILSTEIVSNIIKNAFELKKDILKNICDQVRENGKRKIMDIGGKYVLSDYLPEEKEVVLFTMKCNGKPEFSEFKNLETINI